MRDVAVRRHHACSNHSVLSSYKKKSKEALNEHIASGQHQESVVRRGLNLIGTRLRIEVSQSIATLFFFFFFLHVQQSQWTVHRTPIGVARAINTKLHHIELDHWSHTTHSTPLFRSESFVCAHSLCNKSEVNHFYLEPWLSNSRCAQRRGWRWSWCGASVASLVPILIPFSATWLSIEAFGGVTTWPSWLTRSLVPPINHRSRNL